MSTEAVAATDPLTPAASDVAIEVARPSGLQTLLAPWIALVRPRIASRYMADGPRAVAYTTALAGLFACAAIVVGLILSNDLVVFRWIPPQPSATMSSTSNPTTTYSSMGGSYGSYQTVQRSWSEVWLGWHQSHTLWGWFGRLEMIFLVVVLGAIVLLAFLGWLNLPLVHAAGSITRSYERALRGLGALVLVLTITTFVIGTCIVLQVHASRRAGNSGMPGPTTFVLIAAGSAVLVLSMRSAVRGLAPAAPPPPVLPPRCEGCGYDLTHQPESGLCSECGTPLLDSLDEQRSRPAPPWARSTNEANWWRATEEIIRHPRRFYRHLKLRTSDTAEVCFVRRQFVRLTLGAVLWVASVFAIVCFRSGAPAFDDLKEIVPAVTGAILAGVLVCWFGHRVLAAIMVSIWIALRELPDYRWAAKVVAYETAYLWCFCLFWGVLGLSFACLDDWMSQLTVLVTDDSWGIRGVVEPLVITVGSITLLVHWVARYLVAYRAIRWSNF